MAKATITNINDVPEAMRGEYELRGDVYVLKIEGEHPSIVTLKTSQATLRDNNIRLMQALKVETMDQAIERAALYAGFTVEQLRAFKDVNVSEYQELKAKAAALKEKGIGDPNDLEARMQASVSGALKKFGDDVVVPLQTQLKDVVKERDDAKKELDEKTYREGVTSVLTKAGARGDALDYLVTKSRDFLKYNPETKTVEPKGDKFDDLGQPVKLDGWVKIAVKEHAFAFAGSGGSGANNGNGNGQSGARDGKTLVFQGNGPADPRTLGAAVDAFEKGDLGKVQHR